MPLHSSLRERSQPCTSMTDKKYVNMAQINRPIVVRPTLLTNSAAEFVENHIDSALEMDISGNAQAEFVPEHDRFELANSITTVDYYQESRKRIKEFEETLERFSKRLEKNDLARKIDITLKKPGEYNLKDVLQIADKVCERHKNADDVKSCTGAIRKCFRAVGKNASPLQCLLNFVPSDAYGSVISGGFAVILAAAERVESLRESIYAALEQVPKKLRIVQALSDVNYRSENLYLAVDAVFVSLLKVLDRIVEELSKNMAKKGFKAVIKGKAYGKEIDESLKDLEEALGHFKEEAHICSEQRLGRLEEHMLSFKQNAATLEGNQRATMSVLNKMYRLFTSSEAFDPRTGKARTADYLLAQGANPPLLILSRSVTPEPSPKLNKKVLKGWAARLPVDFVSAAARDIGDSLRSSLHPAQENQVQYIMTSEKLLGWLEDSKPGLLVLQAQTAPQTQANAISLSSAFLAQILRESHDSPVLYHSCGLRTEEGPRGAETSGTIALINSLNSQLARQLSRRADLSFLGEDRYRKKAQRRPRPAVKLLKRLISEVPEKKTVFVIIDSLSRLSGDAESEAGAIRAISQLVDDREEGGPAVKILMTDLLPEHMLQLQPLGEELYVPDRVDVGGHGLNADYLREVSGASIGRFEERRRGGGSPGDPADSGEDLDGSGSDVETTDDESD
ncbi:hypothetical protein KVR01_009352 [Diaporthe batatas]|uniref:uncharacterized protein n=1 Tax=Diaporthe batatas TaxID=748121 RepID=UPI001D04C2CE|nr:uncharacterized protein KVR01_009352 [Diaporthe batatas]KAG8161088.1 hypothetical protein KVR01_009352 [Diaporthe batatas]